MKIKSGQVGMGVSLKGNNRKSEVIRTRRLAMSKFVRLLTTIFVMAIFVVAAVSFATAAEKQVAPNVVVQPGPTAFTCPPGWHQVRKNSEEFKCGPNKPAPITCPDGWKYVEALTCQGSQGLGSQILCSGCEMGCNKIPVIK